MTSFFGRGQSTVVGGSNPYYGDFSSRESSRPTGRGRDTVVGGSSFSSSNYSSPFDTRTNSRGRDHVGGGSSTYPVIPSRGYTPSRRDLSPSRSSSWGGFNWYPENRYTFSWSPHYWLPTQGRDYDRHFRNGNNRPIHGCCASILTGMTISAIGFLARSAQVVALGVILGTVMALAGGCGSEVDYE